MHSLFLDTTSGLILGLLDESFHWLDYEVNKDNRPSEIIHSKIFYLLNKFYLDFQNIRLIYIAGPGSYTGMRLSEGLADIVKWNNIETYSFYHFEVPQYIGVKSGQWITNAFKKEIFSYKWNENESSKELLISCDNKQVYTLEKTQEIIHKNPMEIFSKIVHLKENRETYYFRTLEEEFG